MGVSPWVSTLKTMQEERYQTDKSLFIERAEALGAQVLFDSSRNNELTQLQQVEKMLEEGIQLLVLQPVKSLGKHYAALIKEAMNDFYGEKAEAPEKPAKNVSANKDEKAEKTDRYLTRELAKNSKYIKAAKEKLKPIQTKKHLKLFIDLKKHSNKLKNRILALSQRQPDLSEKQKKKIIKKAIALNTMLKNVGKNKKGKTMKKLSQEIQSLLKFIK